MRLLVARCAVRYTGRLTAVLPEAAWLGCSSSGLNRHVKAIELIER